MTNFTPSPIFQELCAQHPDLPMLFSLFGAGNLRLVGGVVRNALQGLPAQDLDLATPFPPEETMDLLKKAHISVFPTGLSHGTVTAHLNKQNYEITTLRHDTHTDGRHATVTYTKSWEEDAKRRDLTINALSCDENGYIYDYFNGENDLKKGHIRFIGNAKERLEEDHLRLLRYIRFYGTYGQIPPDQQTKQALWQDRPNLLSLSAERCWSEFKRILLLPQAPKALHLMQELDLFPFLCEGLRPADLSPFEALLSLEKGLAPQSSFLSPSLSTRLYTLFSPTDKGPLTTENLQMLKNRFRMSRKEQRNLKHLHQQVTTLPSLKTLEGSAPLKTVYTLSRIFTERKETLSPENAGKKLFLQALLFQESQNIVEKTTALTPIVETIEGLTLPLFPLNGKDLLAYAPSLQGAALGTVLKDLEQHWYDSDFSLSKAALLKRLTSS